MVQQPAKELNLKVKKQSHERRHFLQKLQRLYVSGICWMRLIKFWADFRPTVAKLLMGKDKVVFPRHLDNGDQVVVLNVEKIKFTGAKELEKLYHRHSGYGGGYKKLNVSQVRAAHPDRLLEHAISGMLPKNKLTCLNVDSFTFNYRDGKSI